MSELTYPRAAFADLSAEACCTLDAQGLLCGGQAELLLMLGEATSTPTPLPFSALVAPEHQAKVGAALLALLTTGAPILPREDLFQAPAGQPFCLRWRAKRHEQHLLLVLTPAQRAPVPPFNLERHRANQHRMFANAPEPLVVLGETGLIHEANAAARRTWSLPEDTPDIPSDFRRIVHDSEGDRLLRIILPTLKREGSWIGPLTLKTPAGEPWTSHVTAFDLPLEQGRFALFCREVGGSREPSMLESDLLTLLSHEVRTPLAAARASLALIGDDDELMPEHIRQRLINTVRRSHDHLWSLVDDMFDVEALYSGRATHQPQLVRIDQLVLDASSQLRAFANARKVSLNVQPDLPDLKVWGDQTSLMRVLLNLIDNAIHHAPTGSEVLVEAGVQPDRYVYFRVVDHGPGVPEAQRDRIFRRFVRLNSGAPRPSVGLGLSIVRSIVQHHNGEINVTESRGGGATFTVALPPAIEA